MIRMSVVVFMSLSQLIERSTYLPDFILKIFGRNERTICLLSLKPNDETQAQDTYTLQLIFLVSWASYVTRN